jgi:hypothetical protein
VERVPSTRFPGRKNENSAEAMRKPSTNLGNRSQMMPALGFSPPAWPPL